MITLYDCVTMPCPLGARTLLAEKAISATLQSHDAHTLA
jgi:hypothetical protein